MNRIHDREESEPGNSLSVRPAYSEASPSESSRNVPVHGAPAGLITRISAQVLSSLTREQIKLRNTFLLAHERHGVRSVLVTGASEGAGVTSVAAALALGLSADPKTEVLLIDGNLLQPRLHTLFPLKANDSEHTVVASGAIFLDVAAVAGLPNLKVIPPAESEHWAMMDGERLAGSMPAFRETFDFIVVDAPPAARHPETLVMCSHVDCAILVAEAERTTAQELQETVELLNRARAKLLGVVLNRERSDLPQAFKNWL